MSQLPATTDSQLAIDGGPSAVTAALPAWPMADAAIEQAMRKALAEHTWGNYHGPWSDELVVQLSQRFACEHVHLCSSGTVAVELALRGVGVKDGDEVLLAGYDFPGNFRAIEAIGAMPVLVDVVEGGWVIDPAGIEAAVGELTKAIVVSHLHGQLADVDAIRSELSRVGRADVVIVEDVCQTPGGSIDGRPLGSFGDVAALSFGGSKLLSAGRGGAVLTSDARVAQRAKIANDRGNEAYPLSQLQSIVLTPQLASLNGMNERRNANANRVIECSHSLQTVSALAQIIAAHEHSTAFFKLPFLLCDEATSWGTDRWVAVAQAEGMPVARGFRGFVSRSNRRCRKASDLRHSEIASKQTLLLHHPILLSDDATIAQLAVGLQKVDQHAALGN